MGQSMFKYQQKQPHYNRPDTKMCFLLSLMSTFRSTRVALSLPKIRIPLPSFTEHFALHAVGKRNMIFFVLPWIIEKFCSAWNFELTNLKFLTFGRVSLRNGW